MKKPTERQALYGALAAAVIAFIGSFAYPYQGEPPAPDTTAIEAKVERLQSERDDTLIKLKACERQYTALLEKDGKKVIRELFTGGDK